MNIKLGIIGASGRVGGRIIDLLPEFPKFTLEAAVVSKNSKTLSQRCLRGDVSKPQSLSYTGDIEQAVQKCDALIDFSVPASSVECANWCAKIKKPLLVGTTGHTPDEYKKIEEAATVTPILVAANTSIGIFVLKKLCVAAHSMLGDEFDTEIFEVHRQAKKDAPSGTALALAHALKGRSDQSLILNRNSRNEARRNNEIGLASLRGGDVAGEHTVYFLGTGERIEITHRVSDRVVFARGALQLLLKLLDKKAGLYSVEDVF